MDDTTELALAGDYSARADIAEASALPIARRQLHDELLERLRDLIISCELAPDSKIPEKELCERFGVSRTPLREALKVLAYEGLVVLQPNRGATVSSLTSGRVALHRSASVTMRSAGASPTMWLTRMWSP